jgi:hypothetical protein
MCAYYATHEQTSVQIVLAQNDKNCRVLDQLSNYFYYYAACNGSGTLGMGDKKQNSANTESSPINKYSNNPFQVICHSRFVLSQIFLLW